MTGALLTAEAPGEFVAPGSIVRRIWGDADMVLLIFAGSAAEFALNRAVDWLFFTGRLPRDPIGRLFSTAHYAQEIVFASDAAASATLSRIRSIHETVERQRGERIPDWAYRDVLYMLIDYSERAHATLARALTVGEQCELYDVFRRVGHGLEIQDLPSTYSEWKNDRERHLRRDLERSDSTDALYRRYRRQLGFFRFHLLLRVQAMLAPEHVRQLMGLSGGRWLRWVVRIYPLAVRARLRRLVQYLLMPSHLVARIRALDHPEFTRLQAVAASSMCQSVAPKGQGAVMSGSASAPLGTPPAIGRR